MKADFAPFNWHRILIGLQPPLFLLEIVVRCLLVFCLLLLVMRLMGKRGQNNLSPMQQMLMIALGSAAGDVLLYPTVPLVAAAIVLLGITGLTVLLEILTRRSDRMRHVVESRPRVLVRNGVVDHDALRTERTPLGELYSQLRMKGARSVRQVDYAFLETTGEISVFLGDQDAAGPDDLLEHALLEGADAHARSGAAMPDHPRPRDAS
jgi:uncharacterized membrane protein YcaP (DUF421 family)